MKNSVEYLLKNAANIITSCRFVLVLPVFLLVCFCGQTQEEKATYLLMAIALAAFAEFTDGLDGYVARHCSFCSVTETGKSLDPLADRTYHLAVFCTFSLMGWLPLWLLAIFFVREGISIWFRRTMRKTDGNTSARLAGKAKTISQGVAQIVVMGLQFCVLNGYIDRLDASRFGYHILVTSGVITALSGVVYVWLTVAALGKKPVKSEAVA